MVFSSYTFNVNIPSWSKTMSHILFDWVYASFQTIWNDKNNKRSPVCSHAHLWAESLHAAGNRVHAPPRCVQTGGCCRGAGSHARCSPLGHHPPLPSRGEPGVEQLLGHQMQSLHRKQGRKYRKTGPELEIYNWFNVSRARGVIWSGLDRMCVKV